MNFNYNQIGHLATHSAKLFHRKGTQPPLCAKIHARIPSTYISSATVNLDRFTWSDPMQIETKQKTEIVDLKTKQITVSYNNNHDSVAITPMTAIGLYYELFKRESNSDSFAPGTKLTDFCIEFNNRALGEYNELISTLNGHIKAFATPEIKANSLSGTKLIHLDPNCFVLSVHLKNANLSSNLIAVGLPSITSIGGFFMFLEHKTGLKADFSIGIKSTIKNTVPDVYGSRSTLRGFRSFVDKRVDQRNGDIELTFIVRCKTPEEASFLKTWIQTNEFKIAGGDVHYKNVSNVLYDDCCWLYEADPTTVQSDVKNREITDISASSDALDYALTLNRTNYNDSENKYTVTANGYAFLGEPEFDPNSRAHSGMHVWAEVIFSVIYLTRKFDPKKSFWSKQDKIEAGLLYWSSLT
ncbi:MULTISPECIES: hypothetical protein [Acinetobacter]|uniref:hypothetical protein n=1 Tax=Acinetobacter TaxID=469 RepID=UPI002FE402B9